MGDWVNFAEVRARVSLEDVLLRYYKLDTLKYQGRKLIGPCPVHQGDSPRAFHADLDRNVWHCFSRCARGGNHLDLVSLKERISIREAALKLQAAFFPKVTPAPTGDTAPTLSARAPRLASVAAIPAREGESAEEAVNRPLDLRLDLKHDHPHLLEDRKLAPETVAHFGLGYCTRGILRGTIAIPIHNREGRLIAYAGRRLKATDGRELGKYKFPSGFRKELVLYNFHRALLHEEEGLILVEGFFSVVKLHQLGFPNAVASMGCSLSEAQTDLLALAPGVSILYDGNEAGWQGAETAAARLALRVPTRLVRLPEGLEPEDIPPEALRWLVGSVPTLPYSEVRFTVEGPAKGRETAA